MANMCLERRDRATTWTIKVALGRMRFRKLQLISYTVYMRSHLHVISVQCSGGFPSLYGVKQYYGMARGAFPAQPRREANVGIFVCSDAAASTQRHCFSAVSQFACLSPWRMLWMLPADPDEQPEPFSRKSVTEMSQAAIPTRIGSK